MRCNPVVRIEYFTRPQRIAMHILAYIILLFIGMVTGGYLEQNKALPKVSSIKISPNLQYSNIPVHEVIVADSIPVRPEYNWNPSRKDFIKEIDCLAKNIYFEAQSESLRGQIAVGLVTINRVLSKSFPNTICGVVWQQRTHPQTGNNVAQFSWTWDGKPDIPEKGKAWERAQALAAALIAENSLFNFADFTNGATHYHATYVDPYWNQKFTKVGQIDTHIFYRDERTTPKWPDISQSLAVATTGNNKL